MLREEAINYIKSSGMSDEQIETVINALTCEDCISRQAAIDLADELKDDLPDDDRLSDMVMSHNEGILEYQTKLSLLPSVTPKFTDDEVQKMQELEQAQLDKAYELGKAEMQPCEDCISREETILHISERLYETAMNNKGYEITMDKACEDIALDRLKTWINELPSVKPKAESED